MRCAQFAQCKILPEKRRAPGLFREILTQEKRKTLREDGTRFVCWEPSCDLRSEKIQSHISYFICQRGKRQLVKATNLFCYTERIPLYLVSLSGENKNKYKIQVLQKRCQENLTRRMHNNPVSFLSKSKNFSTRKEPPFIGEKRRRRQGMEANGGQTAILDRRRGNGKERGKYYEAGNGEKSNRAICQISLTGEGMRCAVPGGGVLENAPTAEKPPTGRFFWVLLIGRLLGTFSLTKALAETREIELCSISCRATQR